MADEYESRARNLGRGRRVIAKLNGPLTENEQYEQMIHKSGQRQKR
jgi:hypothetical protein